MAPPSTLMTRTLRVFRVFGCEIRYSKSRPKPLLNPNRLDIHKLTNPELAQFPSITRMLHAAKRQTRIGSDHAVDEDTSGFEFFDEAIAFGVIVGPGR